jgi:hypothetical protein
MIMLPTRRGQVLVPRCRQAESRAASPDARFGAAGLDAVARLDSDRKRHPSRRSVRTVRAYASCPRAHPLAVAIADYSRAALRASLASWLTRQKPVPVGDDAGPRNDVLAQGPRWAVPLLLEFGVPVAIAVWVTWITNQRAERCISIPADNVLITPA